MEYSYYYISNLIVTIVLPLLTISQIESILFPLLIISTIPFNTSVILNQKKLLLEKTIIKIMINENYMFFSKL